MAAEICTDSFLINMLGNLLCTFQLKNPKAVKAVYGTVNYAKTFLYTPGTGVDTAHTNYGFHVKYDPSPGNPAANPPVLPDADFTVGVTLAGTFDRQPDISGNLTEAKEAIFNGTVTMDRDTYMGGSSKVKVTLSFNPGVAIP